MAWSTVYEVVPLELHCLTILLENWNWKHAVKI